MNVTRTTRIWAVLIALVMSIVAMSITTAQSSDGTSGATPEASPAANTGGLEAATAWLVTQQGEEGGFLGFSGEPDAGTTVDAVMSLVAAEQAGIDTGDSIDRAVAWLESADSALVYTQTGVGQAAKLALMLTALGLDPHDFAKVDPLSIIGFGVNPDTGLYGLGVYDHATAMLALIASGEELPAEAITALANSQAANGGWAYDGSTEDADADSNTTALVIQALAASGAPDEGMIESGLGYLTATLRDGQGAAYNSDEASLADSNSTALVLQAVIATGDDPASEEWQDLLTALLAFQNEDGSLGYQSELPEPNLLSTVQAIPALAGIAFPIVPATQDSGTPVGSLTPWTWQTAA
jgi:hypothetical protein